MADVSLSYDWYPSLYRQKILARAHVLFVSQHQPWYSWISPGIPETMSICWQCGIITQRPKGLVVFGVSTKTTRLIRIIIWHVRLLLSHNQSRLPRNSSTFFSFWCFSIAFVSLTIFQESYDKATSDFMWPRLRLPSLKSQKLSWRYSSSPTCERKCSIVPSQTLCIS